LTPIVFVILKTRNGEICLSCHSAFYRIGICVVRSLAYVFKFGKQQRQTVQFTSLRTVGKNQVFPPKFD
jgi:hypothetical protein